MDCYFADAVKRQEQVFRKQIMYDYLLFKKDRTARSGFPMLEMFSESYYKQSFFEKRLEHYFREILINGTICRILTARGTGIYKSEISEDRCSQKQIYSNFEYEAKTGYEFIADYNDRTIMYRYTGLEQSEAENLLTDFVDELVVINWNIPASPKSEEIVIELEIGKRLRYCSLGDFFRERIGTEEYNFFITFLTGVVIETQEFLGVMSVPKMSPYSLGLFRFKEEEALINHIDQLKDYREKDQLIKNMSFGKTTIPYGYTIIDEERKHEFPALEEESKKLLFEAGLIKKYEKEKLYEYLIGKSDFARSFLTSEYLYRQYNCDDCFDYTAIVSGYLKSVEQLLYAIVKFSIDQGKEIKYDAFSRDVNGKKPEIKHKRNTKVVQFASQNITCIDTTMGALRYYLMDYQDSLLVVNEQYRSCILSCLKCYNDECRNNSFHKHNINTWSRVEFIRNNTLFLYIILLAGCRLGSTTLETENTLQRVKNTRIERLYYLIQEKGKTQFEFVYSEEDGDYKEDVYYIPQESQYPVFNKYGLINDAFFMFKAASDSHKLFIMNTFMPQEIWWTDELGNKVLVE